MASNSKKRKLVKQGVVLEHVQTVTASGSQFRGPVPPPEIMERYEKLLPGSAERLLSSMEREGAHRQQIEKDVIGAQVAGDLANRAQLKRGQIFGLIITLSAFTLAAILGYQGHAAAAGSVATVATVALAGIFVLNKLPMFNRRGDEPQADATPEKPAEVAVSNGKPPALS